MLARALLVVGIVAVVELLSGGGIPLVPFVEVVLLPAVLYVVWPRRHDTPE